MKNDQKTHLIHNLQALLAKIGVSNGIEDRRPYKKVQTQTGKEIGLAKWREANKRKCEEIDDKKTVAFFKNYYKTKD